MQPLRVWALLLALSGWVEVAFAASITVAATTDDTTENGTCTLREAIIEANANSQAASADCVFDTTQPFGDDIITLQAGAYALTIAGIGEDASFLGDLDITDPLTIQGAGAANTTIDANGIDRAFHVVSPSIAVSFKDLTIRGGTADDGNPGVFTPEDDGGGIYNNGTLILDAAEVLFCTAINKGGGILSGSTTNLTVQNVSFVGRDTGSGGGNTAILGGGVYSEGTFILDASTVELNSASSAGAGVYTAAGVLSVRNGSEIRDNELELGPTGPVLNAVGTNTLFNVVTNPGPPVFFDLSPGAVLNVTSLGGTGLILIDGGGTLRLTGPSPFSGQLVVSIGSLIVNGSIVTGSPIQLITAAALLGGTGVVGPVQVDVGAVSPGESPGILNVAGNLNYSGGGPAPLLIELNALTAGTGYDQLNVTGSVGLGPTTSLVATRSFLPPIGSTFTVVSATGGLTGQFVGLPDLAQFPIDGQTYQIDYTATSVILTALDAMPVTLQHFTLE